MLVVSRQRDLVLRAQRKRLSRHEHRLCQQRLNSFRIHERLDKLRKTVRQDVHHRWSISLHRAELRPINTNMTLEFSERQHTVSNRKKDFSILVRIVQWHGSYLFLLYEWSAKHPIWWQGISVASLWHMLPKNCSKEAQEVRVLYCYDMKSGAIGKMLNILSSPFVSFYSDSLAFPMIFGFYMY